MARKNKAEEHVNHERWLISYADFITLLFAFFVVMYSVSSVNEGKYRVLSDAMDAAFRSTPKTLEPIQVGVIVKTPDSISYELKKAPRAVSIPKLPIPRKDEEKDTGKKGIDIIQPIINISTGGDDAAKPIFDNQGENGSKVEGITGSEAEPYQPGTYKDLNDIADKVEKAMAPLISKQLITVRRGLQWIEIELNTSILFESGRAIFSGSAIPMLREISRILNGIPYPVRVEGYTDNIPIQTEVFPSNWELSAGRAASIAHLFTIFGHDPELISATGYGEHRPITDNESPEGRFKNRRVVIVVLSNLDEKRDLIISTSDQTQEDVITDEIQEAAQKTGIGQQELPEFEENRSQGSVYQGFIDEHGSRNDNAGGKAAPVDIEGSMILAPSTQTPPSLIYNVIEPPININKPFELLIPPVRPPVKLEMSDPVNSLAIPEQEE